MNAEQFDSILGNVEENAQREEDRGVMSDSAEGRTRALMALGAKRCIEDIRSRMRLAVGAEMQAVAAVQARESGQVWRELADAERKRKYGKAAK